ncbi:MAG: hypothetical protein Q4G58_18015 [bacterium]|nr:hypothetical protein [bacterium]
MYKEISVEFVGTHGKYLGMSLEDKNTKEEELLDLLNGLLFNY